MNKFSGISRARLDTCDPRLQVLFEAVLKDYDCSILCGHRGEADQNAAFESGTSKQQWPNGKHNKFPSLAVDVCPVGMDLNNRKEYPKLYHFAGFVEATAIRLGFKIRWGGDWDRDRDFLDQTFNDLVHFELVP